LVVNEPNVGGVVCVGFVGCDVFVSRFEIKTSPNAIAKKTRANHKV
jgi:hypothetical protein